MTESEERPEILIAELRAIRKAITTLTIVVFICTVSIIVALYSPGLAMATVLYLGVAAVLVVGVIVLQMLVDRGLRRMRQ